MPLFKQKPGYVAVATAVHVSNAFADHSIYIRVVEELQGVF